MNNMKQQRLYYGGDYNPEQWDEATWRDDMELMRTAGVNLVSLGIFSWAILQPDRYTYDFSLLDRMMDMLYENGVMVDLATATASPPAWMVTEFPDVLPIDSNGSRYSHGSRQHYCPNSMVYRQFAGSLVDKLAQRYKNHPALVMWHVNNEYGCHISQCYCDVCQAEFRLWLKHRYQDIHTLNAAWGTSFWSQKYYHWNEIPLPHHTPTFANPGQQLDYSRFMSDSLLACYRNETAIIRAVTPNVPITTNFMDFFKPLDYWNWAKHEDVVSWDSYPDPAEGVPVNAAMNHDMMRSLKHGQPFLLMEQTPSAVNWRARNLVKRPGIMRLWSYQAMAHGADGILFFQWRAARAGAEKFHGAMVGHHSQGKDRVFHEVSQLGEELARLGDLIGSRVPARVAIVFDWNNWWALELDSKPSIDVRYLEQVMKYYRPLFEKNIAVDFIEAAGDFTAYDLVIVPTLYLSDMAIAPGVQDFVSRGGTLLVTFFSGIVDNNDRIQPHGYLGPFQDVLGIVVEEFSPMGMEEHNAVKIDVATPSYSRRTYQCDLWADVISLKTAKPLGTFTKDFYAERPAVTINNFGKGTAIYVGTQPERIFIEELLGDCLQKHEIKAPLSVPQGVEVTQRQNTESQFTFLLNYNAEAVTVRLLEPAENVLTGQTCAHTLNLEPNGIAVLRQERIKPSPN